MTNTTRLFCSMLAILVLTTFYACPEPIIDVENPLPVLKPRAFWTNPEKFTPRDYLNALRQLVDSTRQDGVRNDLYPTNPGNDLNPFVPNQYIIKYSAELTREQRRKKRETLKRKLLEDDGGVPQIDTCLCNIPVELWTLTGPGGIESLKEEVDPDPEVEGGNNYYVFGGVNPGLPDVGSLTIPNNIPKISGEESIIAILDTGVDFNYGSNDYKQYFKFWRSPDDANENCLDDEYGWDFVNNDPAPWDDHGHGTAVTGLIVENAEKLGYNDYQKYRLLPVKTHDYNGVGKLFHVICGLYYALDAGADFINMSWGVYNSPDATTLFKQIFEDAKGSAFFASTGNSGEMTNNSTHAHAPSDLAYVSPTDLFFGTVTAVGAIENAPNERLTTYSNHVSDKHVNVAVPGDGMVMMPTYFVNHFSGIPSFQYWVINRPGSAKIPMLWDAGTSYATPRVLAYAASLSIAKASAPKNAAIDLRKNNNHTHVETKDNQQLKIYFPGDH